jgi:glycerol kinase
MDVLCQLQADLLGIPVRRPRYTETTALGAAYLAGLGAGVWNEAELAGLWKLDREFTPAMSRDEAQSKLRDWRRAVDRSRGWSTPDNQ